MKLLENGKNMKILLVNKYHYLKGGAETYYFTLAQALEKAGHQVIFFSMKHEKNVPCKQERYFVENREYVNKTSIIDKIKAFHNFVYSKEAYRKMSQLIEDEKPDLAILNNIHRQLTTSIVDALYDYHVKTYWVVHDLITLCPNYQMLDGNGKVCEDCCNGNYKHCIQKKCVKNSTLKSYLAYKEAKYNRKHETYKKIELFITPSEFYRKKLIQYGFDEKKVKYIPNPLGFNYKFELCDHDEGYVLYFGRLSREKGVMTLIDATKGVNYKHYIVGTGPLENELKKYAMDNPNIEFKGFQIGEKLQDYIKNSRCVILPSEWYENGPYSAMEAMGKGKPLIVSNMGGLPELVNDGRNGYIYSSKEELREKILSIFNLNDEEYSSMCNKSLNIAKEKFDANKYLNKILNVIGK